MNDRVKIVFIKAILGIFEVGYEMYVPANVAEFFEKAEIVKRI
jgi:hypothetical protein